MPMATAGPLPIPRVRSSTRLAVFLLPGVETTFISQLLSALTMLPAAAPVQVTQTEMESFDQPMQLILRRPQLDRPLDHGHLTTRHRLTQRRPITIRLC